jgi:hypothetical protein
MSIKEECQKELHEVKDASGDGSDYSYRSFTLMEKLCFR